MVVGRWRGRLALFGWVLLAIAMIAPGVWVTVRAVGSPGDEFDRWVGWANILALLVGGLGAALVVWDKIVARRKAVELSTEQVLIDLSARLLDVWAREASLRQVTRPAPVMVRWSSTGRPAAGREVVLDRTDGGTWRQMPLEGDVTAIVDAFGELPHRQLMVLGDPGAGKSVLVILLLLGLLRRAKPGQPVPVLLPINAWDPSEHIDDFVTRRLAEDYADVIGAQPAVVARRLVERQLVLPILDGLDELPLNRHVEAIEVLDQFAAEGRPLVVTCRGQEYDRATTLGRRILSRAAVVEIERVSVPAAIAFLSYPEPVRARWQPVFDNLERHPDGYVATALATPLMVALARAAYRDGSRNPGELLALPNSRAVMTRLMDEFVAGAYAETPRPRQGGGNGPKAADARRWLSSIALHLYTKGTRDLHWWQLAPGLFRSDRSSSATEEGATVAAGLLGALVGWLIGGAYFPPGRYALAAALLVGTSLGGLWRPMWPHGYPPYLRVRGERRRELIRSAAVRAGFAVTGSAAVELCTLARPLSAVVALGLCGLATLVPSTTRARRDLAALPTSTSSRRRNWEITSVAVVRYGAVGGLAFGVSAWLLPGRSGVIATGLVAAAVFALLGGLSAGGWAWLRFQLAHAELAVRNWLPWRLWPFLEDAHKRGVLRRTGSLYQFRHVLLQDHLARTLSLERIRARAENGDHVARQRLAEILADEGAVEELRSRALAGDYYARERLASLLVDQGRVSDAIGILRELVAAGDSSALMRLADLLSTQGRVETAIDLLRAGADAGDVKHVRRLAELLESVDRADEAIALLEAARVPEAVVQLSGLLARAGRVDDAVAVLEQTSERHPRELVRLLVGHGRVEQLLAHANAGLAGAEGALPAALDRAGRIEEAIALLRRRIEADRFDYEAFNELVSLLVREKRVDELRELADDRSSVWDARNAFIDLLTTTGAEDELRELAQGDPAARSRLIGLLAEKRAVSELRTMAVGGDRQATRRLAEVLAETGSLTEAVTLLRGLVDGGDVQSTYTLVRILGEHGRFDELRAHAARGVADAGDLLTRALLKHGRIEEALTLLRTEADRGSDYAAGRLAEVLAMHDRFEELRLRANRGNGYAAAELAGLLAQRGRLEELRTRAGAGDSYAAGRLIPALADAGRVDEAVDLLQSTARTGDMIAMDRMVTLLVEHGRTEDAVRILGSHADAGDRSAARKLSELTAQSRRVERLEAEAEDGDRIAGFELVEALEESGRRLEAAARLRRQADDGEAYSAARLAGLLIRLGRLDEVRERADQGDGHAARLLAAELVRRGQIDRLRERADRGDDFAAERLARRLAELRQTDELRVRATAGDKHALRILVDVLTRSQRIDEAVELLRQRAEAGDPDAPWRLVDLLAAIARTDDLRAMASAGNAYAAGKLAQSIAGLGDVDAALVVLRAEAEHGDEYALWRLIDFLAEHRRVDELKEYAAGGNTYAAESLAELEE